VGQVGQKQGFQLSSKSFAHSDIALKPGLRFVCTISPRKSAGIHRLPISASWRVNALRVEVVNRFRLIAGISKTAGLWLLGEENPGHTDVSRHAVFTPRIAELAVPRFWLTTRDTA
jgi:hypothetical protein